jgi:hypothetical protein
MNLENSVVVPFSGLTAYITGVLSALGVRNGNDFIKCVVLVGPWGCVTDLFQLLGTRTCGSRICRPSVPTSSGV